MEKKWLPANPRERLMDICKDRKITQAQLADAIGMDRSILSRFLSGKTDNLSHEYVIKIAKHFNVSTDFVLGLTEDPGRVNYDIGELGLTVQAAANLYTHKVDPAILCRLLEHERCGDLINEIGLYLDETLSAGIAAQNQLYNSLSQMLIGHAQEVPADRQAVKSTVQTIQAMKPPMQSERDRIHADFDQILLDMKKDGPARAKQAAVMTKTTMKDIAVTMPKGTYGTNMRNLSPDKIVNSIISQLKSFDPPEAIRPEVERITARLSEDLTDYFNMLKAAKELVK